MQEAKQKFPTDYMIIMDKTLGLVIAMKIPNKTAEAVIKSMSELMCTIGIPTMVRSYDGPYFKNSEFKAFCDSYGVRNIKSSAYYPQSNG